MNFVKKKSQFSALVFTFMTTIVALASTQNQTKLVRLFDTKGAPIALYYNSTSIHKTWKQNRLAPKGSAAITSSGQLANHGIKYILHAATGSMGTFDQSTEPTIQSVKDSIIASLKLADIFGVKKVAVPLIGGGIFLDRLNTTKEKLAVEIIDAARIANAKAEVVFVAYTDDENSTMKSAYNQSKDLNYGWLLRVLNWAKSKVGMQKSFFAKSSVVQGSIVDARVHGADAIVNAANMELQFGGGLSGIIGNATQESEKIDFECRDLIKKLHEH